MKLLAATVMSLSLLVPAEHIHIVGGRLRHD
jgi:hypothetical protein